MKTIHHISSLYQEVKHFFLTQSLDKIWFHPKDLHIGISYTLGLVAVEYKPLMKAIQTSTGIKIVDISGFLRQEELGWSVQEMFFLISHGLEDGGELIIDGVTVSKEHTEKMEAYSVWNSCQNRVVQGQLYLVLCWAKAEKLVVIGCLPIREGEKHLEKALELIDAFLAKGIDVKGLRADGFFFKEDFCKALKERHLAMISKPRCDSWWWLGTEEIQLKEYAPTIPIESFHYYREQKRYAKGLVVARNGLGYCKVVIVRPYRSSPPKTWYYLVSTDISLSVRQILKGHRTRWRIEVVFRDCSQHLGLKSHQGYKGSSERHVAMVFLTYNYLSGLKAEGGHTIGYWKRQLGKSYKQERTMFLADL